MACGINIYRRLQWSTRVSKLCNENLGCDPSFSFCICSHTGDYLYIISRDCLVMVDLMAARISPPLPSEKILRKFTLSIQISGTTIHKAVLEERFKLFIAVLSTDGLFIIYLLIGEKTALHENTAKVPISRPVISDIAWDIQSKTGSLLLILCKDSYLRYRWLSLLSPLESLMPAAKRNWKF